MHETITLHIQPGDCKNVKVEQLNVGGPVTFGVYLESAVLTGEPTDLADLLYAIGQGMDAVCSK